MKLDKVAALKRTSLFKELNDDALRRLAERASEQKFLKHQLLFAAGEEARGLHVIIEGAVRAFRVSEDGREQVIHVERAGGTIAEVPVFDDGPYPSNAAAEQATTTLFIEKHDVQRLCLEHPQIALATLRVLAGRLRRCAELVEALSLREVGQRLARFLVTEARTSGTRTEKGIRISLTQTNTQIAARIGTVREVVSRAFTRLQQDGLIVVEGRQLIITDETALDAFAGQY